MRARAHPPDHRQRRHGDSDGNPNHRGRIHWSQHARAGSVVRQRTQVDNSELTSRGSIALTTTHWLPGVSGVCPASRVLPNPHIPVVRSRRAGRLDGHTASRANAGGPSRPLSASLHLRLAQACDPPRPWLQGARIAWERRPPPGRRDHDDDRRRLVQLLEEADVAL